MFSSRRALGRVFLFVLGCLYIVPVMHVLKRIPHPARIAKAKWFHAWCCRRFGVIVETRGKMSQHHPTLFVMNHTSYLDIIVVGGIIPGCFVAKKEIASWPIFGMMTALQRSIFVERRARYAAGQRDALSECLLRGENVLLFPEGTSGDGNFTLPFKSALFSVAELEVDGQPLSVQPVSVTYTKLDGIPLGRHLRPLVTWYGDMDLMPHAWTFLGLGKTTVVVEFHEPVSIEGFGSRRALADYCSTVVATGVSAALSGRSTPLLPPAAAAADTAVPEAVDVAVLEAEPAPGAQPSAA